MDFQIPIELVECLEYEYRKTSKIRVNDIIIDALRAWVVTKIEVIGERIKLYNDVDWIEQHDTVIEKYL